MTNITYSLYEPGDEKQLVELLDLVFGGWPDRDLACSKVDFWRWKYLDNPNGSLVTLAEESGEIHGSVHTMIKKINFVKKSTLQVLEQMQQFVNPTGEQDYMVKFVE